MSAGVAECRTALPAGNDTELDRRLNRTAGSGVLRAWLECRAPEASIEFRFKSGVVGDGSSRTVDTSANGKVMPEFSGAVAWD